MAKTVAHVVGARPNFMKAAPVIRALETRHVAQTVIHTGQHYDAGLSDVFFRDLGLPEPEVNLGVGSGTQAGQTAALMVALEGAFGTVDPGLIVVYGDINSTMAAALSRLLTDPRLHSEVAKAGRAAADAYSAAHYLGHLMAVYTSVMHVNSPSETQPA